MKTVPDIISSFECERLVKEPNLPRQAVGLGGSTDD